MVREIKAEAQISIGTLKAFASAVAHFTGTKPADLKASSFELISAMDTSTLPQARFLTCQDGYLLGYRDYKVESVKQVLVLVHGAGCFGDQMHGIASTVRARGEARVYTLNMRGHGLSGGRRGHAVTATADMIRDLAEFIVQAKQENPGAQIILGGHSAGGGLALAFSRCAASDLVSAYIFFAPFLGLGSMVDRPHFGGWVSLRQTTLRAVTVANLIGLTQLNDMTVLDFNKDACLSERRYVPSWSYATLLAFGPGCWLDDAVPISSDKPVLLLAGSGDECFAQEKYRDAFKIVAPHAEMPAIGECGHWDVLVDPVALGHVSRWLSWLRRPQVVVRADGIDRTGATRYDEDSRILTVDRRKTRRVAFPGALAIAILGVCAVEGHAQGLAPQTGAFTVRVGLAGVLFEPNAKFDVLESALPGANISLSHGITAAAEAGYYVLPNVSLSLTGGVPPETQVSGTSALSRLGRIGKVRYGTLVGLIDYHINSLGRLQPWIGGGPAFFTTFSTKSEAIQDLAIGSRWGGGVQAGAEYMLSRTWGIFGSVSQLFLHTDGKGRFGAVPVRSKIDLDPVVLQAGVTLRF